MVDAFQALVIFDVVLGEAGEADLLGAVRAFVVVESAGFALVGDHVVAGLALHAAIGVALSAVDEILGAETAFSVFQVITVGTSSAAVSIAGDAPNEIITGPAEPLLDVVSRIHTGGAFVDIVAGEARIVKGGAGNA